MFDNLYNHNNMKKAIDFISQEHHESHRDTLTVEYFESFFKYALSSTFCGSLYGYISHEHIPPQKYPSISKYNTEQLNDMLYKPFCELLKYYGFKLEKGNFISHLSFRKSKESE